MQFVYFQRHAGLYITHTLNIRCGYIWVYDMDWLQSPLLFKNRHSRAVAIRCRARVCSVCSLTIVFMVSNMPCWMISISSTCDFCVSFFRGRFLGGSCDAAWSDEVAASAGGSLSFSGAFDESMPPFTDSTPITSMILRQVLLGGGGGGPPPVFCVSALCLAISFFAFNLMSFHFFFNSSVVRIMAVEACSSAWIDFQTSAHVAEPFPGPENFPSRACLCVSTVYQHLNLPF